MESYWLSTPRIGSREREIIPANKRVGRYLSSKKTTGGCTLVIVASAAAFSAVELGGRPSKVPWIACYRYVNPNHQAITSVGGFCDPDTCCTSLTVEFLDTHSSGKPFRGSAFRYHRGEFVGYGLDWPALPACRATRQHGGVGIGAFELNQ